MHIVAIAWIYVTLLMAATEPSFISGAMSFLLYGLGPLALFIFMVGRRRRTSSMPVHNIPDAPDHRNAKSDQ